LGIKKRIHLKFNYTISNQFIWKLTLLWFISLTKRLRLFLIAYFVAIFDWIVLAWRALLVIWLDLVSEGLNKECQRINWSSWNYVNISWNIIVIPLIFVLFCIFVTNANWGRTYTEYFVHFLNNSQYYLCVSVSPYLP
jgi:hypothetical protein